MSGIQDAGPLGAATMQAQAAKTLVYLRCIGDIVGGLIQGKPPSAPTSPAANPIAVPVVDTPLDILLDQIWETAGCLNDQVAYLERVAGRISNGYDNKIKASG